MLIFFVVEILFGMNFASIIECPCLYRASQTKLVFVSSRSSVIYFLIEQCSVRIIRKESYCINSHMQGRRKTEIRAQQCTFRDASKDTILSGHLFLICDRTCAKNGLHECRVLISKFLDFNYGNVDLLRLDVKVCCQ